MAEQVWGCDYCADADNRYYGHVTRVAQRDDYDFVLMRCPKCQAFYEETPAGENTRRLSRMEALEAWPAEALLELQFDECNERKLMPVPISLGEMIGVARDFDSTADPLNAFRHPREGVSCGWYIWSGSDGFPEDADYFRPTHVDHLDKTWPKLVPFLRAPSRLPRVAWQKRLRRRLVRQEPSRRVTRAIMKIACVTRMTYESQLALATCKHRHRSGSRG
jgi:hypothetical protein